MKTAKMLPASTEKNNPVGERQIALSLFWVCVCKEPDHAGMQLPLSRSINMPYITISWLVGWCVCVCTSQREARATFRTVGKRDTGGLSSPSLLSVPIYTNKIQQDKQKSNCMQFAVSHTQTKK